MIELENSDTVVLLRREIETIPCNNPTFLGAFHTSTSKPSDEVVLLVTDVVAVSGSEGSIVLVSVKSRYPLDPVLPNVSSIGNQIKEERSGKKGLTRPKSIETRHRTQCTS